MTLSDNNISRVDMTPVITVDGPSGSGKGTLCQRLADILGFHLLDSGALYRLTALSILKYHSASIFSQKPS